MSHQRTAIITIALLSCLLIAAGVLADSATGMDWWVIGGGGGAASGGGVTLDATLGQTIVGASSGGSIALEAGFWTGAGGGLNQVFLPLLSR